MKYWLVFKIAILDALEYRFDLLITVFKYSFMVMMMALVWLAVERESGTTVMDREQLVRYYIFAAILYGLSNLHTWYFETDIKDGELSKYLVKPISYFKFYYFFQFGNTLTETGIRFVTLLPISLFFGYTVSVPVANALIFILFLPLVFTFSFNLYSLISTFTFWLTETFAIRWGLTIIFRLLSGTLVPIVYFPKIFQSVSFYLPFQHLAFTPIQIMQNQIATSTGLLSLGILFFWTVAVVIARAALWERGVKEFEGTGL